MENQTEEPKNKIYTRWWFWVLVVICLVIITNVANYINIAKQASVSLSPNPAPSTATVQKTVSTNNSNGTPNTNASQTPTQEGAPQVNSSQENTKQANNSDNQVLPRDSNGQIQQLKINASAGFRSIDFTSGENYNNCTDGITVITIGENQQPVFTLYKDSGSINLFAGDSHSIAFGSLTDANGDTLASDIISGKYGDNTAGNWGLTCDEGQYSLTISAIK